ncbi:MULTISPECIES: hypothetical protein [Rhodomicrobium]|uniref:porin n=1 Tax=Rhodomicrobium TaxID=1068 RepID=UPI000B4A99C1|nr:MULTISPECIES: hypothetical protein [Rhodomicrobium]
MFGGKVQAGLIGGALLAAYILSPGHALAADLGKGDAADLEERVAELEATVARKGNRVVSFAIAGQVNESMFFWDDGRDSDAYVVGNTSSQSLINFRGEAKISPTLKAGYYIELGVWSEASFLVSQDSDEGAGAFSDNVAIRHNMFYIEDDRFGRISLGETSPATDSIAEINLARTVIVRSIGSQLWSGGFEPVDRDTGIRSGNLRFRDMWGGNGTQGIGDTNRYDVIKYDSPSVAGFKVSASWGENDFWDVALRYAGLWGQFKVAAGVGYSKWTDSATGGIGGGGGSESCIVGANLHTDCSDLGMSAGIMHVPTGLFAHVAYGLKTDDNAQTAFFAGEEDDTSDTIYIQAGIEKNWFGVGPTTIFGEYQKINSGYFNTFNPVANTGSTVGGAETEIWGVGVNQNFASAALDMYVSYRNISSEADILARGGGEPTGKLEFEDFQEVLAGARIQF